MGKTCGFTVIELMVALAIAAIVASLALPAFGDSLRKSRRSDAVSALNAIQQAQERRRANAPAYTNDLALLQLGPNSGAGYYALAITDATATGYAVTATAVRGRSQAGDTLCTTLRITISAGSVLYGSACSTCTLADPPADPHRCWSRQ